MPNYKNITHVFAAVLSAVALFITTPAGQAIIKQYPWSSGVAGIVLTLAAVYHIPVAQPSAPAAVQATYVKAP